VDGRRKGAGVLVELVIYDERLGELEAGGDAERAAEYLKLWARGGLNPLCDAGCSVRVSALDREGWVCLQAWRG
jgi:hypothetical protein